MYDTSINKCAKYGINIHQTRNYLFKMKRSKSTFYWERALCFNARAPLFDKRTPGQS